MKRISKVVFPAAGLGLDFLPATKIQPKEMLPLVDKPLIQYGVEEACASGLEHIIVVTGRGKTAIEDHFDASWELEKILEARGRNEDLECVRRISSLIHVSYIRQRLPLGVGHAVRVTRDIVSEQPFAVLLPDDIVETDTACLKRLMEIHQRTGCAVVGVMEVPWSQISRYGVVEVEPAGLDPDGPQVFRVKSVVEKPARDAAPSNLAMVGRYVFSPEIFASLDAVAPDAAGQLQLTTAIAHLLERQPVYACCFQGTFHDIGDKLTFLKALVDFSLRRDDLGPPFRAYLKELGF